MPELVVECEKCGYDESQDSITQCERCYKYYCEFCMSEEYEGLCVNCAEQE